MTKNRGASVNLLKMTAKEYEASVAALNIFFGAVIGVSLGNLENTSIRDYIELLIGTSAAVMSILFITYSDRKLYSLFSAVFLMGLIWWFGYFDEDKFSLPPKLLPTLGVWLLLALLTEFWKVVGDFEDK